MKTSMKRGVGYVGAALFLLAAMLAIQFGVDRAILAVADWAFGSN